MGKYYLYVKTDPLKYSLVDEFDSYDEASKAAAERYKGKPNKILSETQALAAGAKQAKRTEQVESIKTAVKSGAVAVGRGTKVIGRAAVGAMQRAGTRAAEHYKEQAAIEAEYERELRPGRIQREKEIREQAAVEARERRALEFEKQQELKAIRYNAELNVARGRSKEWEREQARRDFAEEERLRLEREPPLPGSRDYGTHIQRRAEAVFARERQIERPYMERETAIGPARWGPPEGHQKWNPVPFNAPFQQSPGSPMKIFTMPGSVSFGNPEPAYSETMTPRKKRKRGKK